MISIKLEKDGLYRYQYDLNSEETFVLEVMNGVKATCIVDLKGSNYTVNKQIKLYSNSSLHILYRNECDAYISNEKIEVYENAKISAGYMELDANKAQIHATYELLEAEASVNVITTTLSKSFKAYDISCEHKHSHTYSNMENYAINDEHGKLDIIASGKIEKGAKGSKSHQSTRVLTLADGDKENVKVTPLLLIDENDVEASHACGIGEMNPEHLYYLQTRGLDKRSALGLLTLSYVLPILKIVSNEQAVKEELEAHIQHRVGL
ncbi:MAG: SufD family Fe-S cluster assembly protein [Bacilli bacterium]|nr:SufD family Fe-S cluster assembly protein [Bacilli bacterium]